MHLFPLYYKIYPTMWEIFSPVNPNAYVNIENTDGIKGLVKEAFEDEVKFIEDNKGQSRAAVEGTSMSM
jgi:hypothetical protein